MATAMWAALVYLAFGAAIAWVTYEREQGGWVWVVLLWPLVVFATVMNRGG